MKVHHPRRRGFTTVELLVTLGIVGLIAALAIPVMSRMGLFSGRRTEMAAREFFTLLRATKVYATAYNTEAALAYGVVTPLDSITGETLPVIDLLIVVRRFTSAEITALGIDDSNGVPVFTPIRTPQGRFAEISKGACVLLNNPDYLADPDDFLLQTAMERIRIRDPDSSEDFEPRLELQGEDRGLPEFADWEGLFPAHVFSPGGEVLPHKSTKQRVILDVALLPDADPVDRFLIDADTGQIGLDEDGDEIALKIEVILYTTLGRVKVNS